MESKEYRPEEIKVVEKPQSGSRINGKVVLVEQGMLKDFIPFETLLKWKEEKPEKRVIKVTSQLETGISKDIVITLPEDGKNAHHLSKMAKWVKSYGSAPAEGQNVYLIADGQGYYQYHL